MPCIRVIMQRMNDEMNNSKNSGPLISDTAVPDIFFVQYMMSLSKEAVCLYFWMLMQGKNKIWGKEDILKAVFYDEKTNSEALAELLRFDVVQKSGEDDFSLCDLKMREIDEYYSIWAAKGKSLDGLSMADNPERDSLALSINNTFYMGKMNQGNYRLIDKCLYDYKFEPVVVYRLFQEGKERKQQFNYDAMCRMAEDWYKSGMTTANSLEEHVKMQESLKELISVMGRISRKKFDGLDMERFNNWVKVLNITPALAEFAYKANEYRGRITMKNVEDTLMEWLAAGITEVHDAEVYESEKAKDQKKSYKRRKSSNNPWKSGAEMNIAPSDEASAPADNSSEGGQDILDLFGADNEDN